jgi:hypothetical protein
MKLIDKNRINARRVVRYYKIKRSALLRSAIADFSRASITLATPPPQNFMDGRSIGTTSDIYYAKSAYINDWANTEGLEPK